MQSLLFKLHQDPRSRGVRWDSDGLFVAGVSLLERDERGRFKPRPSAEIRKVLSSAYREDADWASRIRSVEVVAKALNQGDLARAMMAAVLMRMPEPDSKIRIADVDGVFAKAGYNPDEPRDEDGRWASDGGGEAAGVRTAQIMGTTTIPWGLVGEGIGEGAIETVRPMQPPTDIIGPTVLPYGAQNPYPNKPQCVEEWAAAMKFCQEMMRKGKLGRKGGKPCRLWREPQQVSFGSSIRRVWR